MERSTSLMRLGRDELVFRDVNERIREIAGRFGVLDVCLFVCECGRGDCAEAIELALAEYDALRSLPGTYAMVAGHEAPDERVLARRKGYNIVRGRRSSLAPLHQRAV
jgi:hypothetical protein